MANRKITFTLPENLVGQLIKRVPARQRSRYVAQAVSEKLAGHDRRLLQACLIANQDPEVHAIEKDFDSISGEIAEPWSESKARRGMVGQSRSRSRLRN